MANVYYRKNMDRWVVQKSIRGKVHHYGTFMTREKAEEFRDYCEEHDWSFKCKINNVGDNTPRRRIAHMYGVDLIDIPVE